MINREFEIWMKVETSTGEMQERFLFEGSFVAELNTWIDDHGYNQNSGNSLTMGSEGQKVTEVDKVIAEVPNWIDASKVNQELIKYIEMEIEDGDLEEDE